MDKDIPTKAKKATPDQYAVKVSGVSKTFRIPHERINSIRGAAVNLFRKNSFEEFKALDDVSFEVKKGEFFGILGRNGSGKSTLLKILAGIYEIDKGKVEIKGLVSPFLELGIGFNPELSGRDNVYLNATVLGMTKKQIDEKFDSIVKFSELERFIDQKLKNYSSGMQVRLAFSVSIHANREILLMDEVLAVGDSNFASKCLAEFHRYKELGRTVILVTHDIATVQRYCDRAMLLRSGKIVKIGKAEEVGNEYIYQNMSDEEKRIMQENTERLKTEEKKLKSEEEKSKRMKGKELELERKRIEEERKRQEKERREQEEERRNKVAEITKVEFLDANREIKNVFETGQKINVEIEIEIRKKIENPIFGIVIKDEMKNAVFITNTNFKKIKTGMCNPGKKKVTFSISNYLATGTYAVSPAVATSALKILDWKNSFKSFSIINREFSSGAIADFETNIIIT